MNGQGAMMGPALSPVVKNLLIINGLFFLLKMTAGPLSELTASFGMYYFASPLFKPWQILTHMFMHANFMHLFTNMFGLFIFGPSLERFWGSQRFLIYYMVTGLGAAILHSAVNAYSLHQAVGLLSPEDYKMVLENGRELLMQGRNYANTALADVNVVMNVPVVGASGAIFGILLAYGMTFPNNLLMLLFFPFPIKAKYFVILYGLFELYSGLAQRPGDNVAHFAHLGGMLFGILLVLKWRRSSFY